jgi:hypothetical protein
VQLPLFYFLSVAPSGSLFPFYTHRHHGVAATLYQHFEAVEHFFSEIGACIIIESSKPFKSSEEQLDMYNQSS